jgi:regulator of protease activity HflC (stomatin/prohibitin superfamily)
LRIKIYFFTNKQMKFDMAGIFKPFLKLLAFVLVLIILVNIFSFFIVINPGERGVLLQLGTVKAVYEPGLHFQIPIVNSVVVMDVRTQKTEDAVDAASKDLQSIEGTVALNYHVDPPNVDKLYQQVGLEYASRIISPAIQESVKASTAKFTAEELITKRQSVKEDIRSILEERLGLYYLIVDDLSIVNFTFSEEFNRSIEAKQTAEQNALKAANDLKRIQIEAQQSIESAKAQAESIRIQGEALKENAGLVQLKMVEKWNGQLPYYAGQGNMLINLPEVR